ncbi:MAG TPA: SAM-dependent methyltransferase, partial [bacterium]
MTTDAAPKTTFTASVSENYARYMVPIFFAPFAEDLAARAAALSPQRVLELAAGTGAVTRALARML